jgi:dolichol kinase
MSQSAYFWLLFLLLLLDESSSRQYNSLPLSSSTMAHMRRPPSTTTTPRGGSFSSVKFDEQRAEDEATTTLEIVPETAAKPEPSNSSRKVKRMLKPFAVLNKALHRKKPEEISKKLKNRNTTNVRRKLLHCSFGLTFAALNHFLPRRVFLTGMTILSSGTLLMELLRYNPRFHFLNDILHGILGSSLRKHEMEGKFTGSFYFFMGVTLTAACFDRNCATLGIAQLALADPSASYFGRATRHVYWSRIENGLGGFGRNKGVLGFLGGALFCFPFNYQVLSIARYYNQQNDNIGTQLPGGSMAIVAASLALGFAGAFADLAVPTPAVVLPKRVCGVPVPPLHIDDNFVVPIVSAWACEKVFAFLHWKQDAVKLATFLVLEGAPKQLELERLQI